MKTALAALLSIVLSVAAQFLLKSGVTAANAQSRELPHGLLAVLTERNVILGFLLYGLGAVIWLYVLSKWDVSKAYPLVGLGFALSVGVGFVSGENVTSARVLGVALVCLGVLVVGRS
ncbi:MAG TPA: hypothetical protein PK306_14565 [Aquabacterium sp.]|nr:hypothetical protein [Aquabacterium sp.]HQC96924.1 hypothetical protein [Aquabacterium sp.]